MTERDDYKECEFAYARLGEIRLELQTAIVAISLLASDETSQAKVQAMLAMKTRFDPNISKEAISGMVNRVAENAEKHTERDFHPYRATALISLCSAMEALVKNILVQYMEPSGKWVKGLDSSRFRFHASDFLLASDRERKFAVADEIWKDAPAASGHFDKIQKIFSVNLPTFREEFKRLARDVRVDDFDAAFAIRNSLKHDGGVASASVAKQSPFKSGERIALTAAYSAKLFTAIEQVGGAAWVSTNM